MKRRRFIMGLGAISGGVAIATETGAFSAARVAKREADIAVVNDANAMVGLVPNEEVAGVKHENGQLSIDIGDDNPGINVDSVYQFGFFVSHSGVDPGTALPGEFPYTETNPSVQDGSGGFGSAFLIANQTSQRHSIEIDYQITDNTGNVDFWFEAHNNDDRLGSLIDSEKDASPKATLGAGDAIGVSFLIDARRSSLEDESAVTGSLEITTI